MDTAVIADLSAKMTAFLETGAAPEGLFHPDAVLDVSMPTWRIQALGVEDLIRVRKDNHPWPGKITPTRLDPTPNGFVLEFEERWEHDGQHWYCREMLRADVSDSQISSPCPAPATGTQPASRSMRTAPMGPHDDPDASPARGGLQ